MTLKSLNRALLTTSWLVLCVAFTPSAIAQERVIEEIVVTAEKRAESVQDVGLSVQAFDQEGLARGGITDVSRLEFLVSGVNFAFVGNDAKFNVRGANSTQTFSDNSSIVGAFVDGVYKPRASQQTRAFFDVDRVEFLKGPQGTLYGRNTFAGALNLHTNRPDFEGVYSGVDASIERFDRTRLEGFVNLPISDDFALRVAAFSQRSDGYIENNAGPDIGAEDDLGFRISGAWEPSDNVDLILRYSRIEEDGREAGLFGYTFLCRNETPSGHTDPFGSVQNCANPVRGSTAVPSADQTGPYNVSQDFVPRADLVEDVISLEVNAELGPVLLKSITSYTDYENLIGFDFDFSPTPNSRGWFDETTESFTQEIQFNSNYDSPLQWTTGLYYSQDETFYSFSIFQQTVRDDSVRPTVGVVDNDGNPVLDDMGAQLMLPVLLGTPLVSLDTSINGFFADSTFIDIETLGVYGQVEYSLQDNLRLIGGLRYNDEDKDLFGGGSNFTGDTNGDGMVDSPVTVLIPDGASPIVIPNDPDQVFAINSGASDAVTLNPSAFTNYTWRAGIEYDVGDDAMLYFTASTGFLSGALNANGTVTDEQESQVYEVGYKSQLLDNTLQFNIAGHYTEYTNLLTQFQVPIGGIVQTFSQNGGEIEAFGIEVEAVWFPLELLTLSANASYLDSEFGVFGQVNPYQLFMGEEQSFIDVKGQTTPWSPEFTLSLIGSYEFSLKEGEYGTLTPYVQFYYSDEFATGNLLTPDPNQLQDSFTKTDLRLIWDSPERSYSVEAFVENIEDEAVLGRGNNNGDDLVQTGFLYPRNAGLRVKARF